ncbi:LuxR C-terminal-related transcriptional regulator [Tardiphaga sp. 804_B3_N1_9]|uniref:LuxR C-terminal-related transcriptional regulator n=1 Tax=Tardiphaga TaxID=1395974 RepID=UPI001586C47C|nr:response regulator transcription factor [Tardiphaga robiniae]
MSVILVVDQHSVYRAGLKDVVEARLPHSRVIEASRLEVFETDDCFDLILMDRASLNDLSLEVLAQVYERRPATRVAIMSTSNTRADVFGCLSAGFHGFVYKLQSDEELLTAISDLLTGRIYVPRWLADGDHGSVGSQRTMTVDVDKLRLTRRQHDVLPLLAQGMSNKEIARELSIAEGTSKIHTAALLRALGARNRTEAAFMAARIVGPKERTASRASSTRFMIEGMGMNGGRSRMRFPA